MINAGMYNKKIKIYQTRVLTDNEGFQSLEKTLVLEPHAHV